LYADSAYTGENQEETISKYEVHEKGYRNKPLNEEQKKNNTEKSKIRATDIIGLINSTYNLFRYEHVKIEFINS
jgi:IS5 family transposase